MPGLVDYAAVIIDLRGRLLERPSWGAAQLRSLIDELEQTHRVNESADAATLRRFGDHVAETVLDLLPSATTDPLTADDRHATSTAMDDGAAIRSLTETEAPCPPTPPHPSPPRSRPDPASPTGSRRPSLAAATT